MFEFLKFTQSLLPTISKGRVLEDIEHLRDEVRQYVVTPYEAADEFFKKFPLKDKSVQAFDDQFRNEVAGRSRANYITGIHETFKNAVQVLDVLDDLVDKYYGKDISATGMTFLKANMLRHIEAVGFAARYARMVLLYTYAAETAIRNPNGKPVTGSFLTKPERDWMFANAKDFRNVCKLLRIEPKNVKATYAIVPDVTITQEAVETMQAVKGSSTANPHRMNFISSKWWPVFHIRMAVVEWQKYRRDKAAEELKALEYRLLHLRNMDTGQVDARIEREIDYLETNISKLSRKIDKLEGA